jgi:hypothetical protein
LLFEATLAGRAARTVLAFLNLAGWPLAFPGAFVVNIPAVRLLIRMVKGAPPRDDLAWVMLGISLWALLQFASIAFGRAGVANRYIDIAVPNLLVNLVIALYLPATRYKHAATVWWAAIVIGLCAQAAFVPSQLEAHARMATIEEANTKAFLSTGVFPPGAGEPQLTLPYPDPNRLAMLLSDPKIRRFLPSNLQAAMPEVRDGVGPDGSLRIDRLGSLRDVLLAASWVIALLGALGGALLFVWSFPNQTREV